MSIRTISLDDVEQIKQLADSFLVRQGEGHKKYGFFEYTLSLDQYKQRARDNPFFLLSEQDKIIDGFCMAYEDSLLDELLKTEQTKSVLNEISRFPKRFAYIDMFVVRNPNTIKGARTAKALKESMTGVIEDAGISKVYTCIAHKPWENKYARRFDINMGFVQIGEYKEGDMVLGVYELNI